MGVSWPPASWASLRCRWWYWTTSARLSAGRISSPTTRWRSMPDGTTRCWPRRCATWSRWLRPRSGGLLRRRVGGAAGVRRTGGQPGGEEEGFRRQPADPVTRPGDLWTIGKHRLVCGDCRDRQWSSNYSWPARAPNVCITSPPYATQREYDSSSGFKPIPPDEYVDWYADVAANVAAVLAEDGSYFLNIKEHADDGERSLYVKDLVLAHSGSGAGASWTSSAGARQTTACLAVGETVSRTHGSRCSTSARQQQIKFRPKRVGHESEDCFDYSPNNPKSTSGSGLLGTGARGAAAAARARRSADCDDGRHAGVARPSNVIEVKSESSRARTPLRSPARWSSSSCWRSPTPATWCSIRSWGAGPPWRRRRCWGGSAYGCEIVPAYCDVIVRRMMNLTGEMPVLISAETGQHVRRSRRRAACPWNRR